LLLKSEEEGDELAHVGKDRLTIGYTYRVYPIMRYITNNLILTAVHHEYKALGLYLLQTKQYLHPMIENCDKITLRVSGHEAIF